ncbi:hypothetical protein DMP06_09525 [Slackia equolifaciens]|uniref:Uncharacterized protein n=1 Tax=Slackia equolifaciens TaxID=498718 RepID=A0A3N0AUK2_9ACTN|nr:hypothetical protein [Slackia equolifaciens]RNL38244.1 hypothetical protein DMP06_09525 [Slackia equolifaciens]
MLKRLASLAFSVLLACGLVPAAAFAQPDAAAMHAEESMGLVEGSYAEHEALAYVVDDAQGGIMPFSLDRVPKVGVTGRFEGEAAIA